MKTFYQAILGSVAGAVLTSAAWAAELPETYVVGVGLNANTEIGRAHV